MPAGCLEPVSVEGVGGETRGRPGSGWGGREILVLWVYRLIVRMLTPGLPSGLCLVILLWARRCSMSRCSMISLGIG